MKQRRWLSNCSKVDFVVVFFSVFSSKNAPSFAFSRGKPTSVASVARKGNQTASVSPAVVLGDEVLPQTEWRRARILRPFLGRAVSCNDNDNVEYLVLGTSHFRCQSAQEVAQTIEQEEPDAVVVELDPERLVRLTKEQALSEYLEQQPAFGSDLLAAIDTAQSLNIPLFVGDECAQATRQRFCDTLFAVSTYNPLPLIRSVLLRSSMNDARNIQQRVDILQTFAQDHMKLIPLVTSFIAPLIAVLGVHMLAHLWGSVSDQQGFGLLFSFFSMNGPSGAHTTLLTVLLSLLASVKVYNTWIVDRDEILTHSTRRAAHAIQRYKRGDVIRKTWTFSAESVDIKSQTASLLSPLASREVPLFTLKTTLEEDATRHLNLFEPRWLSMVDRLSEGVVGSRNICREFGCVDCVNKFYSVIRTRDGKEGRYADVMFERTGRKAELMQVREGERPSGARKVYAEIQGRSAFVIANEASVTVSKEGYLRMPQKEMKVAVAGEEPSLQSPQTFDGSNDSSAGAKNKPIKVLVIVGLLHANGILSNLSEERNRNKN